MIVPIFFLASAAVISAGQDRTTPPSTSLNTTPQLKPGDRKDLDAAAGNRYGKGYGSFNRPYDGYGRFGLDFNRGKSGYGDYSQGIPSYGRVFDDYGRAWYDRPYDPYRSSYHSYRPSDDPYNRKRTDFPVYAGNEGYVRPSYERRPYDRYGKGMSDVYPYRGLETYGRGFEDYGRSIGYGNGYGYVGYRGLEPYDKYGNYGNYRYGTDIRSAYGEYGRRYQGYMGKTSYNG